MQLNYKWINKIAQYNLNPYAFKVAKKECKIYEIKYGKTMLRTICSQQTFISQFLNNENKTAKIMLKRAG